MMAKTLQSNKVAWRRLFCLCFLLMLGMVGCNRNPYMAMGPNGVPVNMGGAPPAAAAAWNQQAAAQIAEMERRMRLLDENNRQLTTQLAQSQQQVQVSRERAELLARQMQDLNGQLAQSRMAQSQATDLAKGLQSSIQRRGGAVLAANSSLARQADVFRSLGLPLNVEGDVIRLSIPSDQLFQPGTAQLSPNASAILDRVSEILVRQFPRQRVAIEGHTDNSPTYGGAYSTSHQLGAAQSMAVLEQMVRRNQVPANQLFNLSHGSNQPVADNSSPTGRSQNRRIDIVVYPDTY